MGLANAIPYAGGKAPPPPPKKKAAWYKDPLGAVGDALWGDTAENQKTELDNLTTQSYEQGNQLKGEATDVGKQAMGKFDPARKTWGSLYGDGGLLQEPGAIEKLYDERKAGTDTYYNRRLETGLANLRQGAEARGSFNSGAAGAAEGNYAAENAALAARDQAGLASAAQAAKEGRLTGGLSSALGLGGAEAGIVTQTGLAGLNYQQQAQMQALQLQLDKLQIDPMQRQQLLNMFAGLLTGGMSLLGGTGKPAPAK